MKKMALGLVAGLVLAAGAAHAVPEVKLETSFPHGGHIHGYLVNPAGQAVSGWVVLETMDGAKLHSYNTDIFRRGRFDIDNLLPGRYRLRAEAIAVVHQVSEDLVPGVTAEVEVKKDHVSRPHLVVKTAH